MIRVTERIGSKSPLVPPKHSRGLAEGTNSEHLSFQDDKEVKCYVPLEDTSTSPGLCASLQKEHPTWRGVTYTPANQRQQCLSLSVQGYRHLPSIFHSLEQLPR